MTTEPTTRNGRYQLTRDRPVIPQPSKKRPQWWAEALTLWCASDLTQAQVAAKLGRRVTTVQKALNSPWAKERRMDIERRTRERVVEAGVSPILQAQMEAPAAMGRIIDASKSATKPLEVASINKDVLSIAGFVTDRRQTTSLTLTVGAKLKQLTDEELSAFANRGVIPESVRGMLPAPEDEAIEV